MVFADSHRALTYLTRSCAVPIDVSITTTPIGYLPRPFQPEDYYTSSIPWPDRVQSMVLGGDCKKIEATLRRLCPLVPLLRSLEFKGDPAWTPSPQETPGAFNLPREIFGGQAPPLRNLSLKFIPPPFIRKLPFTNLTSLTWVNPKGWRVEVRALLQLLRSAPLLEVLTLELGIQSASVVEGMTIVSLNELRELTWSNFEGTVSLTSCLSTPKLRSLTLKVTPNRATRRTDLASILPPHEGHFPLLVEPTSIKYTTRECTRSCQFQSPTGYISVTALPSAEKFEACTPWFLRNAAIPLEQIKHITIQGDYPQLGEFPTERFESLETLELADGGNSYFKLIRPNFHGPTPFVPFPALREVRIAFNPTISPARLAKILEQRKQAGREVKTFRIQGECNKALNGDVAKIRKSVGEVVLQITHNIGCAEDHPQAGHHDCIIQ